MCKKHLLSQVMVAHAFSIQHSSVSSRSAVTQRNHLENQKQKQKENEKEKNSVLVCAGKCASGFLFKSA